MSYLMIRNPGIADSRGFTLLGVSTTRNAGHTGTIGQFGSGSKLSIALLLRYGIEPTIICGNLRMDFFIKHHTVKGQNFRQVCVKYSGKDIDGTNKSSTEDLGFTLEWGVQDWTRPSMALREFVSNAIDGSIISGGSYKAVEFAEADKPRAKQGYTSVFLPLTPTVQQMYSQLGTMFLHFGNPWLLNAKCLPKRNPNEEKVLIYKKGVLVCHCNGRSVYDYNLGEELTLDESRNASEYDVKYSVTKALRKESASTLVPILQAVLKDPEVWEGKLDSYYLALDSYATEDVQKERKESMATAWNKVAGPKAVITSGNAALNSFVQEKGYTPVHVNDNWASILKSYGILSENAVLTANELAGKTLLPATTDMVECVKKVWQLFEMLHLTNGKGMPKVEGFMSVMDGGGQTLGYYIPGGDTVYLHTSLGVGKMMYKVALEECVHYATGSDDNSRDIQDFLLNLITEITL